MSSLPTVRSARHHLVSALAGAALFVVARGAAAQGTNPPLPPPPPPPPTDEPAPPPVAPGPTPTSPPPRGHRGRTRPAAEAYPAPADYGETHDYEPTDAPRARTGFQLALRTGVALPMGDASRNLKMGDIFSPQVPITVDIGGKVIPELFIGGYAGLSVGGAGGNSSTACDRANLSCTAVGLRIGLQIQYHILPAAKVNPWLGYGIGYEANALSTSNGTYSQTVSVGGVEYGHFMGGVDFRVSRVFGVGPFVDLAVGKYSRVSDGNGNSRIRDDEKALHEWFTLGVKFTFFP